MNNQTIDQEELTTKITLSDIYQLHTIEKIIKLLAWICIAITMFFVFQQFTITYNIWEADKGNEETSIMLGLVIMMWLSLFLPLIYIFIWKKTVRHIFNKHALKFRRASNFLILIGVLSSLGAVLWLLSSTFSMLGILIDFSHEGLLRSLAALILVVYNSLQIWYYNQTFIINQNYRKRLLS